MADPRRFIFRAYPCSSSRPEPVDNVAMIGSDRDTVAGEQPIRRKLITEDRRSVDRRRGIRGRRNEDRKPDLDARNLGLTGVIFGLASVLFALVAFLRAPIRYGQSPDCPADGFNGQVQAHRGLSVLWLVVMILCALSIGVPVSQRRPRVIPLLCGLSVGLLTGAVLRVDTWMIGYCFS